MSVPAVAPSTLVLDDELLASAPAALTAAGFADALSGLYACRDWALSATADGESCDTDVSRAVLDSLHALSDAHGHEQGSLTPASRDALVDALLVGGFAMSEAHTSAPASGGEHLVAHAIDLHELAHGTKPNLHGHAVALGSLLMAALWEVIESSPPVAPSRSSADERCRSLATWLPSMQSTCSAIVASKMAREALRPDPAALRDRARSLAPVPSAASLRNTLRSFGAPTTAAELGLDRAFFRAALLAARDLRDRYTVLDLAFALGVLPARVDDVLDASGVA